MLKQKIDQALKEAMLSGDKVRVSVLRGLKSAVLYEEVASGKKETGLSDVEIETVLARESKKRLESIELYKQGGSQDKASAEEAERAIINEFLPKPLTPDQIAEAVKKHIELLGASSPADMGKVIGAVKSDLGNSADGAQIAEVVKKQLEQS